VGARQRPLGVDEQEGAELAVDGRDAVEGGARQLACRDLPLAHQGRELGRALPHHDSTGRMRGTTKSSSARSGASASASSALNEGAAWSGRSGQSSGTAWVIGSTPVVSTAWSCST